jgi:hypothetical protein
MTNEPIYERIARWESLGGKWALELKRSQYAYIRQDFKNGHPCGGGDLLKVEEKTDAEAIEYVEKNCVPYFDVKLKRVI